MYSRRILFTQYEKELMLCSMCSYCEHIGLGGGVKRNGCHVIRDLLALVIVFFLPNYAKMG